MPQAIARMFDSPTTAAAVSDELKKFRISPGDIHVVSAPAATEAGTTDDGAVMSSLARLGFSSAAAKVYADHISRGQALVAVVPPFGYALTATNVMDKFGPVPVEMPAAAMTTTTTAPRPTTTTTTTTATVPAGDDPAPLSRALGWPLLIDEPAPLSKKFGWTVIKPEPETSTTLEKIRKQSDDPAPLSRAIGLPVLTAEPTSSSTLESIKRQSDDPAPLSRKFGWKLLSDEPAPLSKKFGWKLLSDDPAPLSRMLGWATLTKNQ